MTRGKFPHQTDAYRRLCRPACCRPACRITCSTWVPTSPDVGAICSRRMAFSTTTKIARASPPSRRLATAIAPDVLPVPGRNAAVTERWPAAPTYSRTSTRPASATAPTEAINGRLGHLRGSALGVRNFTNIARCLLDAGGSDRDYTVDCDEPANQSSKGALRGVWVRVVRESDRITTVTLNRPERRNAWTLELALELSGALAHCDADDDIREVVGYRSRTHSHGVLAASG
jgi:hypothetical protein